MLVTRLFFIVMLGLGILPDLEAQPTVSFTFDDGSLRNKPGYSLEEWNSMLLTHLAEANVKATFFVRGDDKSSAKGKYLLQSWNDSGHQIANHTLTHPNFDKEDVSIEGYKREILANDSVINGYSNYVKLFRFPYLREGNTPAKVGSMRTFLKEIDYRNGHVTIDASDWYISSRLEKALKEDSTLEINKFKAYYIDHILGHALHYDSLAVALTGRQIKHTLLLHHNLAAALFLGELIEAFKMKGWKIISSKEAFKDPIYFREPIASGQSLLYALLKDKSSDTNYAYPKEAFEYQKNAMDEKGL